METTLLLMLATAIVANSRTRNRVLAILSHTWRAAFSWVLRVVFGEHTIVSAGLNSLVPEDEVFEDGVYELRYQGGREITWMSGARVSNLLALGYTLAYTR